MVLRDVPLKQAYDSDEDDILNDFYIPALMNSTSYKRLAGFFSSTALAAAARGICGLIENGGSMKLVVGARLRRQDIEAIEKGTKSREQAVSELMLGELGDLKSIESEFVKDHVRALAFMIARGKLEIKVAVPVSVGSEDLDDSEGIYHMKVGIFNDGSDFVSFSGSVNESRMGWLHSIEEFKVFCSWINGQDTYLKMDIEKFEKYWNGFAKRAIVIDVPTAVRTRLVELAPANVDELHLEKYVRPVKAKLWKNQAEAIEAWIRSGFRGIFAMATGSGKTLAALSASSLAGPSTVTIVLVPTEPILDQWVKLEIPHFDPSARIIACGSSHPEWKTILPLQLAEIRREGGTYAPNSRLFVVAILNTASRPGFTKTLEGIPADHIQIICDEVHHVGAPMFRECMQLQSCRRLGLSATPERNWDPIGTSEIVEYFGPTIYEYGIKKAIEDGHLCHYKYYPFFASLNSKEFEEFRQLTDKINREIARTKSKSNEDKSIVTSRKLQNLLEDRARIKKKAEDKPRAFRDAISVTTKRPLIIFCEDGEQLSDIETVLKEIGLSYLVYTSKMNDLQREDALNIFRKGETDIILAIRCLDEGLNVPECEGCIIVASSSSEREFIQRRGRILRGLRGKTAVLNDIIVLPALATEQEDMKAAETLVRQELVRVKQLAEASDNEWECRSIIREELTKYGLRSLADI